MAVNWLDIARGVTHVAVITVALAVVVEATAQTGVHRVEAFDDGRVLVVGAPPDYAIMFNEQVEFPLDEPYLLLFDRGGSVAWTRPTRPWARYLGNQSGLDDEGNIYVSQYDHSTGRVVKIDTAGAVVWSAHVVPAPEGTYSGIFLGVRPEGGACVSAVSTSQDVIVMALLDTDGSFVWRHQIPLPDNRARIMVGNAPGGCIFAGNLGSDGLNYPPFRDITLPGDVTFRVTADNLFSASVSDAGMTTAAHILTGPNQENFSMLSVEGGGGNVFLVVQGFVARLSTDGDTLWTRRPGGKLLSAVSPARDGRVILASGPLGSQPRVVAYDEEGSLLAQVEFNDFEFARVYDVSASDSGVFVVGLGEGEGRIGDQVVHLGTGGFVAELTGDLRLEGVTTAKARPLDFDFAPLEVGNLWQYQSEFVKYLSLTVTDYVSDYWTYEIESDSVFADGSTRFLMRTSGLDPYSLDTTVVQQCWVWPAVDPAYSVSTSAVTGGGCPYLDLSIRHTGSVPPALPVDMRKDLITVTVGGFVNIGRLSYPVEATAYSASYIGGPGGQGGATEQHHASGIGQYLRTQTDIARGGTPARIYHHRLTLARIGESEYGAPFMSRPDSPPSPPTSLSAAAGNGVVNLTWTRAPEPDMAAYRVYRSPTPPVDTTGSLLATTTSAFAASYADSAVFGGYTYFYVVAAQDAGGNLSSLSNEATVAVGIESTPQAPLSLDIHPNPSRHTAEIEYSLPEQQGVKLTLYDLLGREVASLAEGERPAGSHTATLDASSLPASVYFVRLTAGQRVETRSLVVVR